MVVYEVNISFEALLETQADVNKFIKEMTDKIIPAELGYVGLFKIEVVDTTEDAETF